MGDVRKVEGWMDSVCFDFELGEALGGNRVFASETDLRRHAKCLDTDCICTVKRVYVVDAEAYDAQHREAGANLEKVDGAIAALVSLWGAAQNYCSGYQRGRAADDEAALDDLRTAVRATQPLAQDDETIKQFDFATDAYVRDQLKALTAQLAEAREALAAITNHQDFGALQEDLFAMEGLSLHRYHNTNDPKYLHEALECRIGLQAYENGTQSSWKKRVQELTAERDQLKAQLAALQSPSPCVVEGHTMAMWAAMIVAHPLHMSDEALDSGAVSEDQGHCLLCDERREALRRAGTHRAVGHPIPIRECSCGYTADLSAKSPDLDTQWCQHIMSIAD